MMNGLEAITVIDGYIVEQDGHGDFFFADELEEAMKFVKRFSGSSLIKVETDVKGNKDYHYYDFDNLRWED